MVSFEIPMLAMLLIPTVFAGSMGMNAIIQGTGYLVRGACTACGASIFLIAAIAELGRAPFDLAEGESELVSGYNIEYSGMKFGMFYAGELLHAFTFGGFGPSCSLAAIASSGWNSQPVPGHCGDPFQGHVRLLGHHVGEIHDACVFVSTICWPSIGNSLRRWRLSF